jgi:hypothetical protein
MDQAGVKKIKYARATYGNLAYDLERAEQQETDIQEFPLVRPRRESERKVKVAVPKSNRTAARNKSSVSILGVLGYMAAACMLIMVLMGYVQLTRVSAEASQLQKNITDLKNNEAKLKIQYESTFDLTKVEEYAVSRLGMMPATNSQIYYMNSTNPDKAVIISDKSKSGLFRSVTTFLSSVVEYFK